MKNQTEFLLGTRDGLLHGGSPDAQGVADLLRAFLHSLGESPSEPGRIDAAPGPGLAGAAGSKPDPSNARAGTESC